MTIQGTEICMRVPLSGERFCVIIFDPSKPVDFAPLHKMNGARMAQGGAPLFLKSLKENGAGAPLLHSPPKSAQEWRNTSPSGEFLGPPKTLQEEVFEAREAMALKASDMAGLDAILAPVREEERRVRNEILSTHHHRGDVVILNLGTADQRAPLFVKLDMIAKEWGPTKGKRSRLNSEIKELERQIERMQNLLAKQAAKKRRA